MAFIDGGSGDSRAATPARRAPSPPRLPPSYTNLSSRPSGNKAQVTTPRSRTHPGAAPPKNLIECAALLPRLEAMVDQWRHEVDVPRTHIDAAQQLTVVLRVCVVKDVELLFL
ncbi:hypothetical protein [Streptomyces sp. NBC_00691]|uniref:hypothetical protein n=1 Tax=Streptomyces sp. NBC_00691 TaxID=2903671 RepID=UPI002E3564F3|nr:hypothetical protein [Streptomyces sp. NBC_00691]